MLAVFETHTVIRWCILWRPKREISRKYVDRGKARTEGSAGFEDMAPPLVPFTDKKRSSKGHHGDGEKVRHRPTSCAGQGEDPTVPTATS